MTLNIPEVPIFALHIRKSTLKTLILRNSPLNEQEVLFSDTYYRIKSLLLQSKLKEVRLLLLLYVGFSTNIKYCN